MGNLELLYNRFDAGAPRRSAMYAVLLRRIYLVHCRLARRVSIRRDSKCGVCGVRPHAGGVIVQERMPGYSPYSVQILVIRPLRSWP